jgi:hypothetical protein
VNSSPGELVAQELVRSAGGTIGLIAAVPITTALAAYAATRARHASEDTAAAPDSDVQPAAANSRPAQPFLADLLAVDRS